MFISKKEYFVEVHAILQEDIDFTEKDLVPNALVGGKLLELSRDTLNNIAFREGYLNACWSGHYNPENKTVECTFRNPVFVDEENGKVLWRK